MGLLQVQPFRGGAGDVGSSAMGRADELRLRAAPRWAEGVLPCSTLVGTHWDVSLLISLDLLEFRSFVAKYLSYVDMITKWYKLLLGFIKCVVLFKLRIWLITSVFFISVIPLHYNIPIYFVKNFVIVCKATQEARLVLDASFFFKGSRYWHVQWPAATILWWILCFSARKKIWIH